MLRSVGNTMKRKGISCHCLPARRSAVFPLLNTPGVPFRTYYIMSSAARDRKNQVGWSIFHRRHSWNIDRLREWSDSRKSHKMGPNISERYVGSHVMTLSKVWWFTHSVLSMQALFSIIILLIFSSCSQLSSSLPNLARSPNDIVIDGARPLPSP